MAGKALKDVTSLCKCPACGELKRMHFLCPHCSYSEDHRGLLEKSVHANVAHRTEGDDEPGGQGGEQWKQCRGEVRRGSTWSIEGLRRS
jgi:ribosomal protein L32